MRTLKFIVEGPVLKPDPECDFSGLVPGLQAEFTLSKEWTSVPKVVAFYSRLGDEYPPQVLKDGKTCTIPTPLYSIYTSLQGRFRCSMSYLQFPCTSSPFQSDLYAPARLRTPGLVSSFKCYLTKSIREEAVKWLNAKR